MFELLLCGLFLLWVGEKGYPFLAGRSNFGQFLWVFMRGFVFLEDAREVTVRGEHLGVVLN